MNGLSKCLTIACVGLLSANSLHAELPPGTYTRLKKSAEEVVLLRIKDIKQTEDFGPGMPAFICRAEIVEAERTKAGHKAGDEIQFQTYYVSKAARRNGFAGPQSPPRLREGWEGRVYLNPPFEDGKGFELAAYGKSFEPMRLRRPQPNRPPAVRYPVLKRLVVHVDSAPLKSGEETVGSVDRGTPLTLHKIQGSWFMVRHQGKWLWIHKDNVIQIKD